VPQITCCFYKVLSEQLKKLLHSNIQKNQFNTDLIRKHPDFSSLKKIMEKKFTFPKTKSTPICQSNLINKVIFLKMVKSSSTYSKPSADSNMNSKPKLSSIRSKTLSPLHTKYRTSKKSPTTSMSHRLLKNFKKMMQ
jgi:hypothetical protein